MGKGDQIRHSILVTFNGLFFYSSGGSNYIKSYEDIEKFKNDCGVSSVMIARAAMWNCSIFRKQGMIPVDDVIKRFLQIVCHFLFN